jgi:hypothetical protein
MENEQPSIHSSKSQNTNDSKSILSNSANYSLQEIFKELKFGRKASDQIYLEGQITFLDNATE